MNVDALFPEEAVHIAAICGVTAHPIIDTWLKEIELYVEDETE